MSLLVSSGGGGSITASNITDASSSGRTVLTGTPAQGRTALGFGGTVTVAQLNAAGADARSAMYYCSDCLTVNGPGSLVAWCGRTSTWRTMDDCLLATSDFALWVNDFITNSNSGEIRGRKGAMWSALESGNNITVLGQMGTGSAASVQWDSTGGGVVRSLVTGSGSATAYVREFGTSYQRSHSGINMFAGIKSGYLSSVSSGFTVRVGLTSSPTNILQPEEDSLCYDVGNVLGALNPSNTQQWLACIRTGAVNQSGSGPTGVSPTSNIPEDLLVVRKSSNVSMYRNGSLIASGVGGSSSQTLNPFCVIANDGTSTTSVAIRHIAFCFGYYAP